MATECWPFSATFRLDLRASASPRGCVAGLGSLTTQWWRLRETQGNTERVSPCGETPWEEAIHS